jgi:transglutaminase-like putative cysteine protease
MSEAAFVTRQQLTSLLLAQALAVGAHVMHLPVWISALWLICLVWRVQILRMRLPRPGRLAKVGLILLAALAVYRSRGSLVGLDGGVLLLIAAFLLKTVETYSRRDALVLVFLGFFVVVTAYLFEDGLLLTLYSLAPVTLLLGSMVSLQASRPLPRGLSLRLAGGLLLQALPLMLLLFVFFPRLGPLWSLPIANDKAVTGLSESMSPGEIAELSQSDAPVLDVSFQGEVPPRAQLYWRALTLERFDGRRWSQGFAAREAPQWTRQGPALNYSVILQPSSQPWLPVLDVATSETPRTWQRRDFRLQYERPVERPLLYQVRSWPQALLQPDERPGPGALQLPGAGNPRSREWARQLLREHGEPQALVAALLRHFNQQPYVYTLRPPLLGENSVDEFLFDSRRGFCGHYAGAMTFVLRAAGIPARVVAGYQGGEFNRAGNYLRVRQFDAHVWVEYWQPGQGWTQVDPTFAVAPQRIEAGLREALAGEQSFLENSPFSAMRYGNVAWLSQLQMRWDNVGYAWQRWVLSYQAEEQAGLWRRWFGERQGILPGLILTLGGSLLLGLLALLLIRPARAPRDPLQQQFQRFEQLLATQGILRQSGEGPQAFAERAAAESPRQASQIRAFSRAYIAQRYASQPLDIRALRDSLRELRRAARWRPPGVAGRSVDPVE